jgi:hypothetical protein
MMKHQPDPFHVCNRSKAGNEWTDEMNRSRQRGESAGSVDRPEQRVRSQQCSLLELALDTWKWLHRYIPVDGSVLLVCNACRCIDPSHQTGPSIIETGTASQASLLLAPACTACCFQYAPPLYIDSMLGLALLQDSRNRPLL